MSGKFNLYLMRHGETIINKACRTQGWCDGVLTKEGKDIAIKTGIGLSNIEFKAVYSSDLGRARKTAQIIIGENKNSDTLTLKELKGLREVYFGKYEGEKEEVMMNDILKYLKLDSFDESIQNSDFQKNFCDACAALDETHEAENYETAFNRMINSINLICSENYENNKEINALIVTHGGILRLLIDSIDKSFNLRHINNASISTIVYDGITLKVKSVNDNSFLLK